eukprot:jgi/Bigna1/59591/fgenesh1_kg.5_\
MSSSSDTIVKPVPPGGNGAVVQGIPVDGNFQGIQFRIRVSSSGSWNIHGTYTDAGLTSTADM